MDAFEQIGLRKNLLSGAFGDLCAFVHHDHIIGKARDIVHTVADEDDAHIALFVEPMDRFEDAVAPEGIESSCRLVEDEVARTHGDNASDGDAAFLPAGKLEGRAILPGIVVEIDERHRFLDALDLFVLAEALVFGTKRDVLGNGFLEKLVLRILEHEPHLLAALAHFLGFIRQVIAIDEHAPLGRTQKAVHQLHQRRFTTTGVADEPDKAVVGHSQRDIVERLRFFQPAFAIYIGYIF